MPNVVSDDFFDNFSRSLLANNQLVLDDFKSHSSTHRPPSGAHRIRVECQLRELDRRTGSQLVRRHLSQVREEDEDRVESDYEISYSARKAPANPVRQTTRAAGDDSDTSSSFGSFLKRQQTSSKRPDTGANSPAKLPHAAKGTTSPPGGDEKINCFELFCVHDSNLLVHRNQVAIEAERLAHRLASLIEGNQSR